MAIKTTKITSLHHFLKKVSDVRDNWGARPWFRGHGDSSWSLLPGIYRIEDRDEVTLRSEFERRALPLLTDREPKDDWEWYFLMQHYGLPTRLLDWTQSALFALYFALRSRSVETATVWMLDPWWLNHQVLGNASLMYINDPEIVQYLPSVHSVEKIPSGPVAIIPKYISQRIVAQQSCFSLFGSEDIPLEKKFRLFTDPRLLKLEIIPKHIPSIKKDMQTTGICETLIFPDLEALCREIRDEWDYY